MLNTKKAIKLLFLILIVVSLARNSEEKCRESYVTVCDSVADIFTTNILTTTTNLKVVSDPPKSKDHFTCLDLKNFCTGLRDVLSVTIEKQINGFCSASENRFIKIRLKHLTFVNNDIQVIPNRAFPTKLRLRRLSMINNSIEIIETKAFSSAGIEEMDLSNNLIEIIQRDIFNNGIKMLVLRRNKINYLEPNSLPSSLEILDLSYNHLTSLADSTISNVNYLQDLRLNHNKLFEMPNLGSLNKLEVLDVSYNNIKSVRDDAFGKLQALATINLSHNKIQTINFIAPLLRISHNHAEVLEYLTTVQINLSYNLIKSVEAKNFENLSRERAWLSLFGNPLSCEMWAAFEKYFLSSTSLRQTFCSEKYFNHGSVPYCIAKKPSEIDGEDIQRFVESVKSGEDLIKCNLNKQE